MAAGRNHIWHLLWLLPAREREEIHFTHTSIVSPSVYQEHIPKAHWTNDEGVSSELRSEISEQNQGLLERRKGETDKKHISQGSSPGGNLAPHAFPQTCELFNVQICKPDNWA